MPVAERGQGGGVVGPGVAGEADAVVCGGIRRAFERRRSVAQVGVRVVDGEREDVPGLGVPRPAVLANGEHGQLGLGAGEPVAGSCGQHRGGDRGAPTLTVPSLTRCPHAGQIVGQPDVVVGGSGRDQPHQHVVRCGRRSRDRVTLRIVGRGNQCRLVAVVSEAVDGVEHRHVDHRVEAGRRRVTQALTLDGAEGELRPASDHCAVGPHHRRHGRRRRRRHRHGRGDEHPQRQQ